MNVYHYNSKMKRCYDIPPVEVDINYNRNSSDASGQATDIRRENDSTGLYDWLKGATVIFSTEVDGVKMESKYVIGDKDDK